MRRVLLVLTALCALLLCAAAARGETLDMNDRVVVRATDAPAQIRFTPTANNVYAAVCFGGGGGIRASLKMDGETENVAEGVSDGAGLLFEARLIADRTYTLTLTGVTRDCTVEMMRSALGRSFFKPISLSNGYSKAIARPYDVHWYSFVADETGTYTVKTDSVMDTQGVLLSSNGETVAENDDAYAPYESNFLLRARLQKGQTYFVRVCAKADATGSYRILLTPPDGNGADAASVALSRESLTLDNGDVAALSAVLSPSDAHQDVTWISTDARVAAVNIDGVVTAMSAGEAQIIALAQGVEARCAVTVRAVPVSDIVLSAETLQVAAGSTKQIQAQVAPENASMRDVTFRSEDETVATVDEEGNVTGAGQGDTTITVSAADDSVRKTVAVHVTRANPVYRALLIGVARYDDGRERIGAVNTTQGMNDMLQKLSSGDGAYRTTMRIDPTRGDTLRDIRSVFRDARATDVSLLYVNCHGGFSSGQAWMEFRDGARITADQLERELREVSGIVVLIIDCCQSGAFLSGEAVVSFNNGVVQAFSQEGRHGFRSTKYRVLTSASSTQDSYRISYNGADSESDMATAFARSLCEGGGWDMIKDRSTAMRADANKDKRVTLFEAYNFVRRRVVQYLSGTGARQDVQVYPMGSQLTLFQRDE